MSLLLLTLISFCAAFKENDRVQLLNTCDPATAFQKGTVKNVTQQIISNYIIEWCHVQLDYELSGNIRRLPSNKLVHLPMTENQERGTGLSHDGPFIPGDQVLVIRKDHLFHGYVGTFLSYRINKENQGTHDYVTAVVKFPNTINQHLLTFPGLPHVILFWMESLVKV